MIGNLAVADNVFQARELVGKHGGHQILCLHAQQVRQRLAATLETPERQRADSIPAPAHREHGRIQQRLDQNVADVVDVQVTGDVGEIETLRGAQRQDQRVLGGSGLQLEVEGAAKALAQGQTPAPIDAAAEGRVDDELHAAGLVEKAFEDDRVQCGQCAERQPGGGKIVDGLLGRGPADADFIDQPG